MFNINFLQIISHRITNFRFINKTKTKSQKKVFIYLKIWTRFMKMVKIFFTWRKIAYNPQTKHLKCTHSIRSILQSILQSAKPPQNGKSSSPSPPTCPSPREPTKTRQTSVTPYKFPKLLMTYFRTSQSMHKLNNQKITQVLRKLAIWSNLKCSRRILKRGPGHLKQPVRRSSLRSLQELGR